LSLGEDFGHITVENVDSMTVLADSNDGWSIGSIVTFLVINSYYWELSSVDFGINQWIDENGEPSHEKYTLTCFV